MFFQLINSKITSAAPSASGKMCNLIVSENYTTSTGEGVEVVSYLKCFNTKMFAQFEKSAGTENRFIFEGNVKYRKIESKKAKTLNGEDFSYGSYEFVVTKIGKSTKPVVKVTKITPLGGIVRDGVNFDDLFND